MVLINFLDFWAKNFVESIRNPFLTAILKSVTYLGEWSVVLAVAVVVSIFLTAKRKKIQAVILAFTTLGGISSAFVLKELIHRQRPVSGLLTETSYSFPSAHAVISVAFYGLIIYFLWQRFPSRKIRILKIVAGLTLVFIIGFSRVYLGVHYLSDIMGGYLIGSIWLAIGVYAAQKSASMSDTDAATHIDEIRNEL